VTALFLAASASARDLTAGERVSLRSRIGGGLATGLALLIAAGCTSGPPPPLGGGGGDGGTQCTPGKTLADGFYMLTNSSSETVTVTSVRLVGGAGQKMTSPAYLVPIRGTAILGLNYWPVRWPTWKDRKPLPAKIAPHTTTNLVFAQTRTTDHPKSATVQVTYTAAGNSYTFTEQQVRVLVAVKC
jgi:hypothetical protein